MEVLNHVGYTWSQQTLMFHTDKNVAYPLEVQKVLFNGLSDLFLLFMFFMIA